MSNLSKDFHDFKQLYDYYPYRKEVETTVRFSEELSQADEASSALFRIATDETIFYPEGGGQPGDTGEFILDDGSSINILDTRYELVDDEAIIFHYASEPLPEGSKILQKIDWERRFTHMQQHSSEHILSGLVHNKYGYMNVGFHLGREATTIDFSGPLNYEEMQEIVAEANRLIWKNNTITATVYTAQEAREIEYRSKIELDNLVRLIDIPGADLCACCGTHVKATGDVGLIVCTSVESYKSGTRITMLAGTRAFKHVRADQEVINELKIQLNSPTEELNEAVDRLSSKINELEALNENTANSIWNKTISKLNPTSLLVLDEEIFTPKIIKRLFKNIPEDKTTLLVLKENENSFNFYLYENMEKYNSAASAFTLLKAKYNARGGGSSDLTQGQIPRDNIPSMKIFPDTLARELNLDLARI